MRKYRWEKLITKPSWHDVDDNFRPDLSSIDFPSDHITIGQMRQQQPDILESDLPLAVGEPREIRAIHVARIEHLVAKKAWAAAIGLPDPAPSVRMQNELPIINDVYKLCGLSEGGKSTEELIRRIETEATRLAKLSIGEGRG